MDPRLLPAPVRQGGAETAQGPRSGEQGWVGRLQDGSGMVLGWLREAVGAHGAAHSPTASMGTAAPLSWPGSARPGPGCPPGSLESRRQGSASHTCSAFTTSRHSSGSGLLWPGGDAPAPEETLSPSPARCPSPGPCPPVRSRRVPASAVPSPATLTCAGAGAAAPLSGSRRSRRNPSLGSGGHRALARATAGQAGPGGCWHLPGRCRRWPEAQAGPPGAMVAGSPSHGRDPPLPGHGGRSGLCRVPCHPHAGAGDAQRHPGTHGAARPALRGGEQGPGTASPAPGVPQGGPRQRPSPAVLQGPWRAAAPWHP